jgi:hypothetical protein
MNAPPHAGSRIDRSAAPVSGKRPERDFQSAARQKKASRLLAAIDAAALQVGVPVPAGDAGVRFLDQVDWRELAGRADTRAPSLDTIALIAEIVRRRAPAVDPRAAEGRDLRRSLLGLTTCSCGTEIGIGERLCPGCWKCPSCESRNCRSESCAIELGMLDERHTEWRRKHARIGRLVSSALRLGLRPATVPTDIVIAARFDVGTGVSDRVVVAAADGFIGADGKPIQGRLVSARRATDEEIAAFRACGQAERSPRQQITLTPAVLDTRACIEAQLAWTAEEIRYWTRYGDDLKVRALEEDARLLRRALVRHESVPGFCAYCFARVERGLTCCADCERRACTTCGELAVVAIVTAPHTRECPDCLAYSTPPSLLGVALMLTRTVRRGPGVASVRSVVETVGVEVAS